MIEQAAQARITGAPCYLGEVPDNPPTAYVVIYPATGALHPQRYSGKHDDQRDTFAVVASSTSPAGAKRLIEHVRDQLTGWTPPGDTSQGPLHETSEGPIIPSRIESETRYSLTLNYRAARRRKATP